MTPIEFMRDPLPVAPLRDRRGQAVNPARRERKRLMRAYGVTTGRQWVRLRKRLRREASAA